MRLEPGQRIGRHRVESLLGSGGMSEVYRGFDELLERPVALKVVQKRRRLSALARARFLREARILSQLDHPAICGVYDLIETDETDVLVLEFVPGVTLSEALERGLSEDDKLSIAEQIADALAAAHSRGIVHRDLKPRNVMCADAGGVKVLDFDLARPAQVDREAATIEVVDTADEETEELEGPLDDSMADSQGTTLGSIVGTVSHMSPEQARGEPLTVASDLYSFGILLHELFVGSTPYAGELPMRARLLQVSRAETARAAGLDPGLEDLIEGLKSLDPEARPSAEEAARRLRALRERPLRRRRHRLRILIAAVVVAASGGALWLVRWQTSRPLAVAPGDPVRVAVLTVHNATGTTADDWVENGLAEMIGEVLDGAPGVDQLVYDEVLAGLSATGMRLDTAPDPMDLDELRRRLGAHVLVRLRLSAVGGGSRLQCWLVGESGSLGRFDVDAGLPSTAGLLLAGQVLERLDRGSGSDAARATMSLDPYANLFYAIALDRVRQGDPDVARGYLELCLDRDPGFERARHRLDRVMGRAGRPLGEAGHVTVEPDSGHRSNRPVAPVPPRIQ